MSIRKRNELRAWMLGAATTGLFLQSYPAVGQSAGTVASSTKAAPAKPAPAQPLAEPRPLPASGDPTESNAIQLTAQTSDGKSEVQRQLEALYEQDGREMPDTGNFTLQPVTPQATTPQPPVQAQPAPQAAAKSAAKPAARPVFSPRTQAAPVATQKPRYQQPNQQQYQPRHQAVPYPNQNPAYAQGTQPVTAPVDPIRAPSSPPPSKNPVVGFFRKISGTQRPLPTQAPVPPDVVHQPATEAPMLTAVPNAPAAVSSSGMRPLTQAPIVQSAPRQVPPGTLAGMLNPSNPQTSQTSRSETQTKSATVATTPVQTVSRVDSTSPEPLAAVSSLPPLADEPIPLAVTPVTITPATTVARTPAVPVQPLTIEPRVTVSTVASLPKPTKVEQPPKVEVVGDFPNPFPDEPEAIADRKQPAALPTVAAAPATAESPKSTLTSSSIEVPEVIAEASPSTDIAEPNSIEASTDDSDEPLPMNVSAADEDPFAVEGKDFVEPVIQQGTETSPNLGVPTLGAPPELVEIPSDDAKRTTEPAPFSEPSSGDAREFVPPAKSSELPKSLEPHIEKMSRIRERFGMKGLKGFCPVSLRDERELVDARLEYQFTYRKQKFHFSSAKAREKFEANPIRYAPAAYGADVVALTRDKDVVEGTLEYAAWYKGRLYLLGTQANYEAFLADPSQYATPDGIE
ncbi:hypothetical protein [Schlesneria paludicola]|uniref:hypothetical protein n=1 Tax=Schlesneria paludicola TaxID=360056 RepID=UPI00029B1E03|nr:hypothetical protein [Schlesneria paludicola]